MHRVKLVWREFWWEFIIMTSGFLHKGPVMWNSISMSLHSRTATQIARSMRPTYMGPTRPRWDPCWPHESWWDLCWPHESCYQGMYVERILTGLHYHDEILDWTSGQWTPWPVPCHRTEEQLCGESSNGSSISWQNPSSPSEFMRLLLPWLAGIYWHNIATLLLLLASSSDVDGD